jgi:phenylpropionate dioxygenase-like ring-hydroxylating dioxygenase large terminal subunit
LRSNGARFSNTWVYVGHDSQVADPGDYFGTTIGTQPVLMVRHTDGTVKVCTIGVRTRARAHHD